MKNLLIVSGHTDLNNSVVNKKIMELLQEDFPKATFDYLEALYPNYQIDIESEQAKLVKADTIVLEFPIFWYAMPSILTRWFEEVFQHGFSHGSTGNQLKNKKLIVSFTTGAPESMYVENGEMGITVSDILLPIKATCKLCQMEYYGHIYSGGVSYQLRNDENINNLYDKANEHEEKLKMMIEESL